MNAQVLRTIGLATVPFHKLLPLGFAQQRQVRQALRRVGNHSFQQGLKILQHPGNRAPIKQIGVIHKCGRQSLFGLRHLQGQIKVRCLAISFDST